MTTVLASHGAFRSCYECAKQSKNYMCDWGNKQGSLVACCEPDSKSIYCQPSEKNKCSPTFEDSKGMFFTHCPLIDNTKCGVERKNMSLKATPDRQSFKTPLLLNRNLTDFAAAGHSTLAELKTASPDQFDACYYIIETPQYLYRSGTLKMEIKQQLNVDLMMFSGWSFAEAVEGQIEEETDDNGVTTYNVDFTQVMVLVVTPQENWEQTAFEFDYFVEGTDEIDWYWKFYIENFTSEEGRKLLYVYGTCIGILICLFLCCICIGSYYCCCKPKVYEDPDMPGRRFSRRRSSRGSSFAASMRRSMRLESIVSASGQSFRQKSIKSPSSGRLNRNSLPKAAKIIKLDKNDEEQQMEDVFAKNKVNPMGATSDFQTNEQHPDGTQAIMSQQDGQEESIQKLI